MAWIRRGFLAVLLVSLATSARAGFDSGTELLALCEDPDGSGFAEMYCLGYITAVADVLERNDINGLRACIPDQGVAVEDLAEAVKAYLRRHPERGHYGAAGLVADALGEAFPCGLANH